MPRRSVAGGGVPFCGSVGVLFLIRQRVRVCLAVVAAGCLSWRTAPCEAPLPEAVPPVLLSAPVNATWAANHLAYWQGKGVQGFLLTGIQDDLSTDLWGQDGDPSTTDAEDSLLREVRLAAERLADAGIDRNFVAAPLAPERPYFAQGPAASEAVAHFGQVAAFCRHAGLCGVAIDTRATSLFYDYRWDGYAYDGYGPSDLDSGARALGRRTVRAVLRAYPDAEILVFTEGYRAWHPLWRALFGGMVESLEAAHAEAVHVLTRETLHVDEPLRIRDIARRTRRLLAHALRGDARAWWERRGSVAVGVGPLGYRDGIEGPVPVAHYPLEAFRVQLAAAKLFSDHYVWIEGNGPTWWSVTNEEAETYGGLLQNGPAVHAQVGPVVEDLLAYTARTPLDAYRRVGPYALGRRPCHVLNTGSGAAVVVWEGLAEQTALRDRETPVFMTELRTGRRHELTATDGQVTLGPTLGPVLVEPLPVRAWVLPASLWTSVPEPPSPSSRSAELRFGFSARSGFRIAGALEAVAPQGFGISPHRRLFELEDGEAADVNATLRGAFSLGDSMELGLGLVAPGAPPVARSFRFLVCPEVVWRRDFDGVVSHGLAAADLDGDSSVEIIACSDAGEVACLGVGGWLQWKRRFPARFVARPVVVRDASGGALIVTVDQRGSLQALFERGRLAWEKRLGPPACGQGPTPAVLDDEPGQEILVAVADGRIVAVADDGETLWSYSAGGAAGGCFAKARMPGERCEKVFVASVVDGAGVLDCVDGRGGRVWRGALEGAPCCAPVLTDVNRDGAPEVLTLTVSGVVQAWQAASGRLASRSAIPKYIVPKGIVADELLPQGGVEVLIVGASSLSCFSNGFDRLWGAPMSPVAPLVVAHVRAGPRILVPTQEEGLVCLDGQGRLLWRDTRSQVPLAGPALVAGLSANRGLACVYADTNRCVRAIELE